ncbi:MAG: S8 family serine peptidase, partial [Eubacterium sp.]
MKKSLKCLSVILVMLITLFSFSVTALAQTTEQDGLQVSLTTDKQSYSLNEDIEITVSVTNTNDFTVEDVSIEALLPDNFELKDSKQETSAKAIDLKAGEQTTLSVIAVVKGEEQSTTEPTEPSTDPTDTTKPAETTTQSSQATTSQNGTSAASLLNVKETTTNNSNKSQTTTTEKSKSTNSKNGKSPYTGVDYALLAVFFVIFFFSLAGLLYGLIVHTKKTKKAVSSVLCFVIAVTSVIGFTSYKAYADDRETSTISISEKIKVDNKDYTVSANVKYQVGGINLTIDNKENTVTDFNQILSGTFSSTSNVVSVTYTIATEIDDYEITDSGNANINDNRYSADIQLKPENNKITVTATTSTDKRESKTVNIKYNSGNSYELDKNHIVYDSKTNTEYVDNVVLILFDEGVTDTRRNEIISQIDGKLVGTANGINQWEVEISKRNLDELEKLCEELKHIDGVFAAHVDKIVKISPDIIGVNDPWENANGGNWYLGAIDAWSAWDYNERFNEINIGIVDNGFDTEHEDLIGKIAFPNKESQQNNSLEQHGTHVAGIIGAKENNNIGVTGLLWKSKLYCVDWQPTENQKWDTINEIMSGLRLTVEAGAKVVNF